MNTQVHLFILSIIVVLGGYFGYSEIKKIKDKLLVLENDKQSKDKTNNSEQTKSHHMTNLDEIERSNLNNLDLEYDNLEVNRSNITHSGSYSNVQRDDINYMMTENNLDLSDAESDKSNFDDTNRERYLNDSNLVEDVNSVNSASIGQYDRNLDDFKLDEPLHVESSTIEDKIIYDTPLTPNNFEQQLEETDTPLENNLQLEETDTSLENNLQLEETDTSLENNLQLEETDALLEKDTKLEENNLDSSNLENSTLVEELDDSQIETNHLHDEISIPELENLSNSQSGDELENQDILDNTIDTNMVYSMDGKNIVENYLDHTQINHKEDLKKLYSKYSVKKLKEEFIKIGKNVPKGKKGILVDELVNLTMK